MEIEWGVCPGGGLVGHRTPPETIGDSRAEFNRILCTSKSKAAATSNKKLRCRYFEADYRQTRTSRGLSVTAELLV